MPLISESIPNLINGVSQQPPSLRLKTQAELQENGLSTVVEGLRKRPSSEFVAEIMDAADAEGAFIHTVRRDESEFYIMIISTNGVVRVFDQYGVQRTVANSTTYLNGMTDAQRQLTATSIADYTFVVNKAKIITMRPDLSPVRQEEALFYVKQGDYLTDYKINITYNGSTSTFSYTTKDASVASNQSDVKTNNIATQLYNAMAASLPSGSFEWALYGSVVWLSGKNGQSFTISVEDSRGNTFLKGFKGQTPDFYDLPPTGRPDFLIKIQGDAKSQEDDYYVSLQSPDGAGNYVWKETIADGIPLGFDASTMPHQLVKQPDGTFVFEAGVWDDREAGDEVTSPLPTFVDKQINDIFLHRNRLGFLSDENVIFSEAGEYYNFFPKTVLTLLDNNPIDVAVSNNQVSILKHAVPFNKSLLMFSDLTQFNLSAGDLLTPETVAIDVATQFEASLRSKPVAAGRFVFFATRRGTWSGVREYFVEQNTEANANAVDVTSHCPRYILGEIKKLTASSNEDMLLAITDDDPNALYVYRYYWGTTEKLQSSWSRWTFEGEVLNADFNMSQIYIMVKRGDKVHLEVINLSRDSAQADTVNYFGINLDRRVKLTADGMTTMPYTDPNAIFVTYDGLVIKQTDSNWEATLAAAIQRGAVWGGTPFIFKYKFSEIVMKRENEPITTSRLQLRGMAVVYYDTGFFKVNIEPRGRNVSTLVFTGRVVGSSNNTINRLPIETGTFKFPVLAKSDLVDITIESDSFLPCAFQSAEWEGYYTLRSTRQ